MLRNNLPPDSQPWARDLEKRIAELELKYRNLNATISTSNSRVSTVMKQQGNLVDVQKQLAEARAYLENYVIIDRSRNPSKLVVENATRVKELIFIPYDPQYDAHLTAQPNTTGEVIVQISGSMSVSTNYAVSSIYYYLEILYGTEVVALEPCRMAQAIYQVEVDNLATAESMGAGPELKFILDNTVNYEFRVRRAYQVIPIQAENVTNITWGQNSIRVNRLGSQVSEIIG